MSGMNNSKNEKVMESVVKLFIQKSTPNYCMPWQMKRQQQSSGSGFVISNRRILTNAHVVAYQKSVRVRKHGDAKKYNARVLHVAHECDLAMVSVDDDNFWDGLEALELGEIPMLEEDVVVVGFPTGGDNISVTRGVVSRVDIQRYSHSGVNLLAIQIDAAINAGNSGGPAFKDGKVVGVAFETLQNAENIGYIIPIPVVEQFLLDLEKHDVFSGFCDLGILWQPIESDHMRKYFKLFSKETGVLVSRVLKLSCSFERLQRGDVLMALDRVEIADDGTVPFRGNERISWTYLLHSKFPDDDVIATVYRAGKKLDVVVKLSVQSTLVPTQLYDRRPSYVVYCGLVFISLSQPYMSHQYGKDWVRKAPIRLCDRILYGDQRKSDQEVIVLSQVLASELTVGYEAFSNLQLYKVNGIPILNLKHLCHVLDKLTTPHVSIKDCSKEIGNKNCDTRSLTSSEGGSIEAVRIEVEGRAELAKNTGPTEEDKDSYTSFDIISESNADSKREQPEKGERQENLDEVHEKKEFCEFSDYTIETGSLYHSVSDDPLLLDCHNFIHFELDKEKVIVLNISEAYTKSKDILEQYAITLPRSENLPEQPY